MRPLPLLICLASLTGCDLLPPKLPPAPQCPVVPKPQAATTPRAPPSTVPQMLQPGHWEPDGNDYHWVEAVWVPRTIAGKPRWRNGFWVPQGGGCTWVFAHWVGHREP